MVASHFPFLAFFRSTVFHGAPCVREKSCGKTFRGELIPTLISTGPGGALVIGVRLSSGGVESSARAGDVLASARRNRPVIRMRIVEPAS